MGECSTWNQAGTLYDFFCWASAGADRSARWRIVTRDGKAHDGPVRYATSEFVVIGRSHSSDEKGQSTQLLRTLIPFGSISAVEFMANE
jgi:hypothetical protein